MCLCSNAAPSLRSATALLRRPLGAGWSSWTRLAMARCYSGNSPSGLSPGRSRLSRPGPSRLSRPGPRPLPQRALGGWRLATRPAWAPAPTHGFAMPARPVTSLWPALITSLLPPATLLLPASAWAPSPSSLGIPSPTLSVLSRSSPHPRLVPRPAPPPLTHSVCLTYAFCLVLVLLLATRLSLRHAALRLRLSPHPSPLSTRLSPPSLSLGSLFFVGDHTHTPPCLDGRGGSHTTPDRSMRSNESPSVASPLHTHTHIHGEEKAGRQRVGNVCGRQRGWRIRDSVWHTLTRTLTCARGEGQRLEGNEWATSVDVFQPPAADPAGPAGPGPYLVVANSQSTGSQTVRIYDWWAGSSESGLDPGPASGRFRLFQNLSWLDRPLVANRVCLSSLFLGHHPLVTAPPRHRPLVANRLCLHCFWSPFPRHRPPLHRPFFVNRVCLTNRRHP